MFTVLQQWFTVDSSVEGCDRASEECVLNLRTRGPVWLSLVSLRHVPVRCTLGPGWSTVCFCWSAGPHIWATCVFETVGPNETHIGTEKCCVCSCIPGSRLRGWHGRDDCHAWPWNGILGIIWWTSHHYIRFYFFLNDLEPKLLCLFFKSCCSDQNPLTEGSSKPLKRERAPCWSQTRAICQTQVMNLRWSHFLICPI